MHRHSSVRQIAYKIRISSAQVERKSSRAARGHRAKVLPKCETIISIPCAVGERRVAVFPLFRAVIPLLSAAVFQAKSRSYQGVSGKSERKCGLSAARLLLRAPAFRPKSRGCPRGCRRGLLQIGRHMQQKWPSGRRAIGPGAVSLWLQIRCKCSQTAPATVQLRDGNTPNSAMHCVKGKPVAVKIGFAVGSAKLVVPLPP